LGRGEGCISLTPVRVDFTNDNALAKLAAASVEAASRHKISTEPTSTYRSIA
jgi:hypothetical protein